MTSGCVTEVRPVSSQQPGVTYAESGGRRTDQEFDPSTINWKPAFSAEEHAQQQQELRQQRDAQAQRNQAVRSGSQQQAGGAQSDQWGDEVDENADIPLYGNADDTPSRPSQYELDTSYVAAGVAPMGSVAWNGRSIPLARPSGGYVAIQSGALTPWNIALAKPGAGGLPPTSIHIYQIVSQELSDRPVLYQKHWLEDVGILGRCADDWGFLIEAPQPDGSRWIGKVSWETGDIAWLVKDEYVNAFASMAPDGRLVWSRRQVNSPSFDLAVELPGGQVATAPHNNGMWLMPSWSCDGNLVFSFYLTPNSELGVAALDSGRGPDRLGTPIGSRLLIDNGVPGDAYDAAIGIPYPTAPDGSPRFLFYHPGLAFRRVCLFDPFVDGITYYKARTGAGGWYNSSNVLVCSSDHMYLQSAEAGSKATELMAGPYLAIPTSPPDQPYLLLAPSSDRSDRAMLLLMQLVDSGRVEHEGVVGR
ncbi:MAG: hypothetical protein D8M59_04545 [Planctomycetes bacterium]|nr:hypothetical protein [Planctomycetota bacterium]